MQHIHSKTEKPEDKTRKYRKIFLIESIVVLALAIVVVLLLAVRRTPYVTIRLSPSAELGNDIYSVVYTHNGISQEVPMQLDGELIEGRNGVKYYTVDVPTDDYEEDTIVVRSNKQYVLTIAHFGHFSKRGLWYNRLGAIGTKVIEDGEYILTLNSNLFDYVLARNTAYWQIFEVLGGIALAVLAALWLSLFYIYKKSTGNKPEAKGTFLVWQIVSSLLIFVAVAVTVAYQVMLREFGEVTMSELYYTMTSDLGGTNWGQFLVYKKEIALVIVISGVLIAIYNVFLTRMRRRAAGERIAAGTRVLLHTRLILACVGFAVIGLSVLAFWRHFAVFDYIVFMNQDSTIYNDYYVDPDDVTITFPEKKKNLVYIFLESMEITHADTASGGAEPFNAIPNLTRLAEEGDDFGGTDSLLQGAYVAENCNWTVAGITAQSAGIGLSSATSRNYNNTKHMLSGATAIGNILEDAGYSNTFMMGSRKNFGNRGHYLSDHGDFSVLDLNWARRTGRIPEDYYVWWGFEDKKLFEYAKTQLSELAASEQPFNFQMLTVDTHYVGGYRCEDCPDTYPKSYANIVACSDSKVGDLVDWIREQPWGEDTVIVIAGDHLFMNNGYFGDIDSNYERRSYVTILNSQAEEGTEKRDYTTLDLFPTTLAAMGCEIEGDRLGLGTNLYSDQPTLLEELGIEEINEQLTMNSSYYDTNFIENGEEADSAS